MDCFTDYIRRYDEWERAKVHADEGAIGTDTRKYEGIEDDMETAS